MGINKVNYGNTTLIDTSNVTVTADKLLSGYTALDNTGALITGTASVTPDIRPLTVTADDTTQVIQPEVRTLVDGLGVDPLNIVLTISGTESKTVSFDITSGETYYVEGTGRWDDGGYNETFTISGEWECGTALPFTGSTHIYSIVLTPTLLKVTADAVGGRSTRIKFNQLDFYEVDHFDGYAPVTVNPLPDMSIGTKTVTNSSSTATSLAFSGLSGEPKAFFIRCTSPLSRSSNISYYHITTIRYDGTNTYGNYWRMSTGYYYADTSHYSFTYSNGTLTVTSSGSRSSAGGSFYDGNYELTYIY